MEFVTDALVALGQFLVLLRELAVSGLKRVELVLDVLEGAQRLLVYSAFLQAFVQAVDGLIGLQ